MKNLFFRPLLLALALIAFVAQPARAQDEYKKAYNAGIAAAEAKNYPLAYTEYERAADLATKAGDSDIASKSHIMCAKLAKINGTGAYKAGDYEEALAQFEAGLGHESQYTPNLYMKGLTLKKLGRTEEGLQALSEATNSKDSKTARTALKALRDHFHSQASALVAKENISSAEAERAIALIDQMETYEIESNSDTYFYLGLANKAKGNYAAAIGFADQALGIHRGGRSDKAKLFFLKGESLMLNGDNDGAKTAFREAAFGSYKALADHYVETL